MTNPSDQAAPAPLPATNERIAKLAQTVALLSESEARTQLLIKSSSIGLWDWNLLTNEAFFSSEWKSQLGYDDAELTGGYAEWESRLHPEDHAPTLAVVQEFLEGRRPDYEVEFRLRHKDGSWRWILARAILTRAAADQPVCMMGCHIDITERKQAEERLRQSEARFAKAFRSNPGAMCITTIKEGRFIEVNDHYCRLFGFTREELIGQTSMGLALWDEPAARASLVERLPLLGYIRDFAAQFRRRNRELIHALISMEMIDFPGEPEPVIVSMFTDTTERVRAARASERALQRLNDAQRIGQIGDWDLDLATQEITWSPQVYEILGRDPRLGPPTSLEQAAAMYEPASEALLLEKVARAIETGEAQEYQLAARRPDGERVQVQAVALPRMDGNGKVVSLSGTVQNISACKLREAVLRKSEECLRLVTENAKIGLVMVDRDRRYTFANAAYAEILGLPTNDLVGQHVADILGSTYQDQIRPRLDRAFAGERVFYDLHRPAGDGERCFAVRYEPTIVDGEVSLVVVVLTEITERKRAEAALHEAHRTLEQRVVERTSQLETAYRELALADRHKSEFLAGMSHELRTPLNAIIGFTGTLLMELPGPLNAVQATQLRIVETSAKHLLSLLNDILELVKIESGKVELEFHPASCKDVLEEVASTLRPLARRKGLTWRLVTPSADCTLHTDRRALSQILINLVSNAIKFTEHGGITIELAQRPGVVEWRISDTGIGIKAEDQTKLFHVFTQLDARSTRRYEGTGLGLNLSQRLATLLGGRITFTSELGAGSTFIVSLPSLVP